MPLAPIKMKPAYRFGAATPWGGNELKTLYGLDIPDERTGEALVVSAIDGLCSTDENGTPLPELLERYGKTLAGERTPTPFPLLLKLLDARDRLSVQVHPNDEYALLKEHKLGKTEAWVILKAEKGARLIYGVKPGTTPEALRAASVRGAAVEELLCSVPVREGEVYFIPSGMVHAICEGIVLYELQQSSDVTYRFYDWERRDAQGKKRELHLDKALEATDVQLESHAAVPVIISRSDSGQRERLLDTKYFGLDRLTGCVRFVLTPDPARFSILTALEDGGVEYGGALMKLRAGETALLPADGYPLCLTGGCFLLAYPAVSLGTAD